MCMCVCVTKLRISSIRHVILEYIHTLTHRSQHIQHGPPGQCSIRLYACLCVCVCVCVYVCVCVRVYGEVWVRVGE
jgi:hypothetical protein